MSRWKELPASLDPRVGRLIAQLRRLKDHSGLSLSALAAKTPYSRSSWERYLNGKALPPRQAVEALASVTGAEPTRLLALHEVAAEAGSGVRRNNAARQEIAGAGEGEQAPAADVLDAPGDPPRRGGRAARRLGPLWAAVVAGAVGVAVLAGVLIATALSGDDEGSGADIRRAPLITAHRGAFPENPQERAPFRCDIQRHAGRTYAGHSITRQRVLEMNSAGWTVVEAQCLLRDAGFSPGVIDGLYGDNTTAAVKRLQEHAGIADDGEVGPDTWKVLRK